MTERRADTRLYSVALAAIIVLGLALRIASAQGDLWLDEAWSALLARDAGTPLGIFLYVNHDNNHHLNTLWLQIVGFGAPPVLARALSIVTGTIAIGVAAMIGARRGRTTALVTALLFAISPMLVTLGSEARGYAPMSLAFLTAVLLVDRSLAGAPGERTPFRLALCAALGALSQLTIVFGWVAITGWVGLTLWRRDGFKPAVTGTLRLLWPSFVALGLVLALIFGAAYASPTGFQFGRYEPFTLLLFLHATVENAAYSIGSPLLSFWLLALVAALVVLARSAGVVRLPFYWLAILAFPITLALLHAGNVGHPRYYLVASLALLLLVAELVGRALVAHGWRRIAGAVVLAAMTAGMAADDIDLIRNQRGDPGPAIAAMRADEPQGTTVLLDRDTALPMVDYAAAHARYPVIIVVHGCRPAPFLFADRFKGEDFPATIVRCGHVYDPIASAMSRGLSGTHWTLYRQRPS